jgi:hypothetical protein
VLDWLARRVVPYTHAGVLDYLSRCLAVVQLPAAAQATALSRLEQECRLEPMFGTVLGESRARRLLVMFQGGQLRLRGAVAAVAAARYRGAHGCWPGALADLVPEYLSQIPHDSFAEGPFRYRRLANGVVIYSIGRDGRDNGGKVHVPPESADGDIGFRLWDAGQPR